jgi:hypothetical protein
MTGVDMDSGLGGEASRMMRLFTAGVVAAGLALVAVPALAAKGTPAPTATPGPLAYYIMLGKTIVSDPFSDVNECVKAVQKLQRTTAPGYDQLVCAHRRP